MVATPNILISWCNWPKNHLFWDQQFVTCRILIWCLVDLQLWDLPRKDFFQRTISVKVENPMRHQFSSPLVYYLGIYPNYLDRRISQVSWTTFRIFFTNIRKWLTSNEKNPINSKFIVPKLAGAWKGAKELGVSKELRSYPQVSKHILENLPTFLEWVHSFGELKPWHRANGAIVAGRRLPSFGSGPFWLKDGWKIDAENAECCQCGSVWRKKYRLYIHPFFFVEMFIFLCSVFLLSDGNWCTGLPHHRWRKWVAGWVDFWHKVNRVGSLSCLVVLGMA